MKFRKIGQAEMNLIVWRETETVRNKLPAPRKQTPRMRTDTQDQRRAKRDDN